MKHLFIRKIMIGYLVLFSTIYASKGHATQINEEDSLSSSILLKRINSQNNTGSRFSASTSLGEVSGLLIDTDKKSFHVLQKSGTLFLVEEGFQPKLPWTLERESLLSFISAHTFYLKEISDGVCKLDISLSLLGGGNGGSTGGGGGGGNSGGNNNNNSSRGNWSTGGGSSGGSRGNWSTGPRESDNRSCSTITGATNDGYRCDDSGKCATHVTMNISGWGGDCSSSGNQGNNGGGDSSGGSLHIGESTHNPSSQNVPNNTNVPVPTTVPEMVPVETIEENPSVEPISSRENTSLPQDTTTEIISSNNEIEESTPVSSSAPIIEGSSEENKLVSQITSNSPLQSFQHFGFEEDFSKEQIDEIVSLLEESPESLMKREMAEKKVRRYRSPTRKSNTSYTKLREGLVKELGQWEEARDKLCYGEITVPNVLRTIGYGGVYALDLMSTGLDRTLHVLSHGDYQVFQEGKHETAQLARNIVRRLVRSTTQNPTLAQEVGDYAYLAMSFGGGKKLGKYLKIEKLSHVVGEQGKNAVTRAKNIKILTKETRSLRALDLANDEKISRPSKTNYRKAPEKIKDGPSFPTLKAHANKHGGLHPHEYYNRAVDHIKTGTKIKFRHEGQNKIAYITRIGEDSFKLTSTVRGGRMILTHIEEGVTKQHLMNRGITLSESF